MKKIFSIISVSIMTAVIVFISALCFIKTNIPLEYSNPYHINIFYHSTATITDKPIDESNSNYTKVLSELNKITNVSVFNRLLKEGGSLKPIIEQDLEKKFTKYSTEMKKKNIVVELVFNKQQDAVVYFNGNSKVVSYSCILYVIPDNGRLNEIVVYHSPTPDDTNQAREKAYANCEPFVLYGNGKDFSNYIKTLIK